MKEPGKIMAFFSKISRIIAGTEKGEEHDDASVVIPSFSESGTAYIVNLGEITCTCPDWTKQRHNFPKNDPRRLCKHLVKAAISDEQTPFSPIVQKYAEKGWSIHPSRVPKFLPHQTAILMPAEDDDGQWCEIAHANETYGYSMTYDKWAHDKKPPQFVLDIFFAELSGQQPVTGTIRTIRRGTEASDMPVLPSSWGASEKLFKNGGWVAFGRIGHTDVRCCINPRSGWQCFVTGELFAPYNVKNDDWRGPKQLSHMREAAIKWMMAEYADSKKK